MDPTPSHGHYRLITCDLDETLIPPNRIIGERARRAVTAATQAGCRFVLSTGRGVTSVQGTLDDLGLKDHAGEYVLSYNGALLTANDGKRVLDYHGLDFDKAEELYQFGLEHELCMHVYTPTETWVRDITPSEIEFLDRRVDYQTLTSDDLSQFREEGIAKVLFMNTDMDYLHQIADEISPLSEGLEVSYSSSRYLEFNAPGVSMGEGLVRLAERLDIPIAQTIAIGDNNNDLTMVQAAGLGCAVANAVPELVSVCDYHSSELYDEGVAEIIERFVLD